LTKSSAASNPGLDKRRSTRVVQALPIRVKGLDALQEPFTERTSTVMVSCHGCKYQSRHYVPKGSLVTVEIPRYDPTSPPRTVTGNVIWVQRPNHAREILHIGLEFATAGNVWDLPSPPEDWFPLPGEPMFVIQTPEATLEEPPASATSSRVKIVTWDESEISAMAAAQETHEARPAFSLHSATATAEDAAEEANAEGVSLIGQGVDAQQLRGAIEEALTASIDRISEAALDKILQQAAERSAEIIEEARRVFETAAEQLDEKIQKTVEEALDRSLGNRHGRSKFRR
jgi:hypothetical protein